MNKEFWTGKNKLAIKIVAGVVAVALVGTGIGVGVVKAKNNTSKDTEVATTKQGEKKDNSKDNDKDQEELLKQVIKTQVGSDDATVGKEENVYVITDANGASKEVIVSDWLKNPQGKDTLKDASDLKDIKNVKGDETFTSDKDGALSWKANGNDIYYQGTTEKAIPVDVRLTYYLDGKEMKPQDMAGKSGKVTIRFDYDNKEKKTVQINNKDEEVYVPFTVMSAMVLPTDKFADITVKNGKVMSEGSNNIIMGLAFPGLQKSLNVDEKELKDKDIEIPDYVEVNAVTSDFSLDMTLSVVLSDALSDIHLTDSIDFSDIDKDMDKLTDASSELQDGTGKLKDGVNTLSDKTSEFQDGAKKLSDGITTLKNGADQLQSGATELANGASTLNSKVQDINLPSASISDDQKNQIISTVDSNPDLATAAQTIGGTIVGKVQGINASDVSTLVVSGIGTTSDYATLCGALTLAMGGDADAAKAALDAIIKASSEQTTNAVKNGIVTDLTSTDSQAAMLGGIKQVAEQSAIGGAQAVADKVNDTMGSYSGMIGELKDGTQKLADGANTLSNGVSSLDAGAAELQNGANTLVDGTNKLADGVNELKTGANDLDAGMVKFDKEGISKLTDAFEGEGKNVVDRLKATMDASHDYHTFTKLADGMDGSVKFIIRTEAVK